MVAYMYETSAASAHDTERQTRPFERIAREIAEQIRAGQLVRGQKLPTEREMGEHFGVSRGVIREAVKMLDAMGLVESRQGSGTRVRSAPRRPLALRLKEDPAGSYRRHPVYRSLVDVTLQFLVENVGGVASAQPNEIKLSEDFLLRRTRLGLFRPELLASAGNPGITVSRPSRTGVE